MKLNIDQVPADRFRYDSASHTFTAEMSDLNGYNTNRPMFDDSCDIGFSMLNTKSGNSVDFCLTTMKQDAEGEIQSWEYQSVKQVGGYYLKVTIFND